MEWDLDNSKWFTLGSFQGVHIDPCEWNYLGVKLSRTIFYKKKKKFLVSKNTKILLFFVTHNSVKMNIIRYHLLPNSTTLKLWNKW